MAHASVQLVPESAASEGQSPTTTLALLLLTSEGALVHEFGEHDTPSVSAANVPRVHRTAIEPLGV